MRHVHVRHVHQQKTIEKLECHVAQFEKGLADSGVDQLFTAGSLAGLLGFGVDLKEIDRRKERERRLLLTCGSYSVRLLCFL